MKRKWLLLPFLSSAALFADEDCCFSSCECLDGPCSGYFNVRHREPGGIGYPRGYTSADLFYLFKNSDWWSAFLDFRGHIFNDGKWASNAGFGFRFTPCPDEMVYGINLYWDYREAKHTTFHQVGAGLEFLWPCWDLRVNGYAPINRHKKIYRQGFDKFQGHTAFFFQKLELALSGGDINLGYWLLNCGWFKLHGGIGGYYFQGDYGENAGGGLLRTKLYFWDRIFAEGQVSYDNQFKWQGQGELSVRFPFGPTVSRCTRSTYSCCDLLAIEERLIEQPQRFEIVVSTTHKKTGRGRNPNNGQLVNFYFVDSLSGSNGTFESPFPTLVQAENASGINDAIYLFPGDGSSYGINLGINAKDYQLIGGSGAPFEMLTRFGTIDIPAQTTKRPKVGGILILANRNYISGLEMHTSGNSIQAIFVELPVVRDSIIVNEGANQAISFDVTSGKALIERNIIQADAGPALSLGNITGTVELRNNKLNAPNIAVNDAAIFGNIFNGVFVVENNVISSDMKGIHLQNFTGEFRSNNNQILSLDDKIEVE